MVRRTLFLWHIKFIVHLNRLEFMMIWLGDLVGVRKLNVLVSVLFLKKTSRRCSLLQEWKITRLSYEYDSEPFGKERDAAIKKLASEAGVEVTVRISHTLYVPEKWVCICAYCHMACHLVFIFVRLARTFIPSNLQVRQSDSSVGQNSCRLWV